MNRKDEHHEARPQNSYQRQRDDEFCKYSCDEFEEVEAEAEASIEYSPKGTYKHVNIKARRTRASLHRSFPNRNGGKPEGAPRTSNSRKGSMDCSQRSRIPTSVGVRHKASVSSVSLQMELQAKKSGSDMSVLRKCISSHSQPSKKTSVIQQRLNSAKEIQIKDLTSKVRLLETTIQDLTAENRTLKNGWQRQAAALQKYEGAESDFPRVLTYHQNEVKYLQQSVRKTQGTCRKYEAMIRGLNNRIILLEDHNAKLQKLVESDELDERQKLQRQVMEMSQQVAVTQETLADHARQFDLLQRNHAHQLASVESKLKISDKRVFDAEQELYRLTELIRQKDRVISYLRMRSRNPGLEPPLHRKVMEEYKSSYKYFYQVEDSSELNQGCYYTGSTNSHSPSHAKFHPNDTHEAICSFPSPPQTASTGPSSQRGERIVYCRSAKSHNTSFSEELARRSRERNLDVPCSASEFDEEEQDDGGLQDDSEGEDIEEAENDAEGLTEHEPMTAGQGLQRGVESEGSGTTYVVFNEENEDAFEGFPDFEERSGNAHEHFEKSGKYKSPDSPQETGRTNSPEKRCRLPIRNKRTNMTMTTEGGEDAADFGGNYESGDMTDEYYRAREDEDGETPRAETGLENGAGDAGVSQFRHKGEYPEEYPGGESLSEDYSDEEPMKYSEEEFYCESGGENEARSRNQTPAETNFGRREETTRNNTTTAGSSLSRSPSRPSAPVKSGLLPLDNKYFTFTSKPTYVGEMSRGSDENQSGRSKHDFILNSFTPPASAVSGRGMEEMDRALFYKDSPVSNMSTADSHNTLASFHKNRPKGPGPIDDETPSGSRSFQYSGSASREKSPPVGDVDPDEELNDEFWTLADSTTPGNRPEPQRNEGMTHPLSKEIPVVASKKKISPTKPRDLRNKQPPVKQPIKNKAKRFTTF